MSRYRGPRLRVIRRLINEKRELPELPGFTGKETNKKKIPGQHGTTGKKSSQYGKILQYGTRLKEKQKLRYNYGVTESQLIKYMRQAKKLKGSTGEILLQLLEMRLDNILFRLGFAPTIIAARQLITHNHILVNKKKINIPSYQCAPKDIISIDSKQKSHNFLKNFLENSKIMNIPSHLTLNKENFMGVVNSIVNRESVGLILNELLIVEYYSRKI